MRLLPILMLICCTANAAFAQDAAPARPAPTVTVVKVTMGELVATVPVSGTLVAREEVLVNAQITGYEVRSLAVDVGDRVKADDVLATLDTQTLDAAVAQAEAEVVRAQAAIGQAESQIASARAGVDQSVAALERANTLMRSGNTTQATLDQSQAAADTARAVLGANEGGLAVTRAQAVQAGVSLDIAKLNRARAEVRAPVNGVVSSRDARIGTIATGAAPLFVLIRDGEVEMEAEIVETDLGRISVGDEADIAVAGVGTVSGTVRVLSPTVDAATRLGTVRVRFPARDDLRPGLFGAGSIVTDRRTGLSLPIAAVQSAAGEDSVKMVLDGKVEQRTVKTGIVANGMREIVEGVSEGDTVLARAGAFFRDGDAVTPLEPSAPTPSAVAEPGR
ncbi:efflux RND transporter periplasmic adaptor subunit [Rhizobiaceae bacterium]|nr:efflux RND transporter periplasmic adaptor subunit [Rhizobiaceae bacterium]